MTSAKPGPQSSLTTTASNQPVCAPFNIVSDLLETYCPKLTNPVEPGSYVMPSRFSYCAPDNPKYSDEESRQWNKQMPKWKHRNERESVRLVMEAIGELAYWQNAAAPFMAIEGLDLHKQKNELTQILRPSNVDQRLIDPCLREFDVILFGERIGLIIIEIKAATFVGKQFNFSRMRKLYLYGFEQVNAADSLLPLIEHLSLVFLGAKFKIPATCVRKIVVTTRLSKARYESWFNGLSSGRQTAVNKTVGSTQQWFEEDSTNGSMIDKVRSLLEEPGYSIAPQEFRRGIRILSYLRASPIFKKFRDEQCRMVRLETLFSERHARMDDFAALQVQNPELLLEKSELLINDKKIVLTEEQQAVLGGPDHQLIFGTAGTGKSVVLSLKAIDCLERGRSVLILATESYMQSYHDRLEPAVQRGRRLGAKLEIWSWPRLLWSTLDAIPNCHRYIWDIYHREMDVVELVSKLISTESERQLFRFMDQFDDVFLDDALEYTRTVDLRVNTNMKALLVSLAMMAYAIVYAPRTKTVWIGLDRKSIEWKYDPISLIYRDTLDRLRADGSISKSLTRVMRNGEKIFKLAYEPRFLSLLEPYMPLCGHKIPGHVHRAPPLRPETTSQMEDQLWRETKLHLHRYLVEQKYKRSQIGIIVGGTGTFEQTDKIVQFLLRKCRESDILAKSLDFDRLHHEKLRGTSGNRAVAPADKVIEDDKILIDFWHQASSKEWPIVIHVEVIDFERITYSFDAVRIHRQHRARTRAVSQLVEIRVVPSTGECELSKSRINHSCAREVDLYDEVDHNPNFRSQTRTERLDELAGVALQIRDDLYDQYRETGRIQYRISKETQSDYQTRLFSKIRKRCHSVSDLRSTNDARHPALVLDCEFFELLARGGRKLPDRNDSRLRKVEDIVSFVKTRSGPFWNSAIKRDIMKVMERVLWWKVQTSGAKGQKEMNEHQNILAIALDSFNDPTKFGECVLKVVRILSASPAFAEYLRVNLIEIYEGDPEQDSVGNWCH